MHVALDCPTTQPIARALDEMKRLDPLVNLSILDYSLVLEPIVMLRGARQHGYPVEIPARSTAIRYAHLAGVVWAHFPKWKLKQLPADDPRRASIEQYLAQSSFQSAARGKAAVGILSKSVQILAPELYPRVLLSMQLEEAIISEKVARVRYDIARLMLAARIVELDGKATSSSLALYVPDYLPEMPLDPFTGAEYHWNDATGQFYSIGPDQTDQKGSIIFNVYHGKTSAGDITLP